MIILESILLGLIQGLTEFLPVSSSAHLTLIPQLLHWKAPLLHSLAFDVALHFGTLVAVVLYFRKDLALMISRALRGLMAKRPFEDEHARLGWWIVLGTIPAVIAALLFQDSIETVFRHPPRVAVMLIGFGLIMGLTEWVAKQKQTVRDMSWLQALVIGVAQALALMPGVSRSGATISAGLALDFKRGEAARFAFLLSIPAILGATVFAFKDMVAAAVDTSWLALVLGTVAAAVSGYACIAFLLAFLQKRSLWVFVFYRIVFGALVLFWYYGQH